MLPAAKEGCSKALAGERLDSGGDHVPWRNWSEVPLVPPKWARNHYWLAEVFAGEGGATKAHVDAGGHALPPIELDGNAFASPQDILADQVLEKLES